MTIDMSVDTSINNEKKKFLSLRLIEQRRSENVSIFPSFTSLIFSFFTIADVQSILLLFLRELGVKTTEENREAQHGEKTERLSTREKERSLNNNKSPTNFSPWYDSSLFSFNDTKKKGR